MNVKAKGYVLGIVAAATYGMNPLFALPLYEAGMNPDSVLFFRYLFAIPVLGAMIKLRGRDFKLKRKEILPLVIMGLLVALSSLTLFQSYNYMAAGIASTLLFVYPIMVALIMAFLFKEKLTLQTILCIIAVDELGRREDVAAVEEVLNAGVKLIATAHGRDFADIETRPQLRALVRRKIFERYLFLSNRNGTGTIEGLCDREGKMIAEEEMTMKKEEEA